MGDLLSNLLSSSVQTFFPDTSDPYLVLIVRCKIVTETISIPLNLWLLIAFHRLYLKHKARSAESRTKSPTGTESKGCISDHFILILTYILLIFGFIFSICQGLLENFALTNCADIVNTYFEFFFYIGHRTLLLLIFLNRLFLVFAGSAYSYPMYLYYILLILIIICGVLSFISHSFNLAIMKVPSGWPLWNDGDNVCAWQFGPLVTHVTRPLDYALNATILFLFLYKLAKLQSFIKKVRRKESQTNSTYDSESHPLSLSPSSPEISATSPSQTASSGGKRSSKRRRRRREHTNLEIVARRMSILTFIAIISSVIVTGGYLGYDIRIIGALWPFDLILNSFCCVLMFRWTNFMIRPCFGKKCDRCCCIKCLGCCECVLMGCCEPTELTAVELAQKSTMTVTSEDGTKQSDQERRDTLRSVETMDLRSQCTDRSVQNDDVEV